MRLVRIGLLFALLLIVSAVLMQGQPPSIPHHQRQLVYTKLAPDNGSLFVGDVYLLDMDTGEITALTDNGRSSHRGWLPTGDLLHVLERPRGSVIHDFVMDLENGSLTPLAWQVSSAISTPVEQMRSYDGKKVIFQPDVDQEAYVVMDTQLTPLLTIDSFDVPSWLPDNETLFYQNEQACLINIHTQEETCWDATNAALSRNVDRPMVAYTTDKTIPELCVGFVEGINLVNQKCYDQHEGGIVNLSWRP